MKNSDLLYILANANRQHGYDHYANFLEDNAVEKEAEEIKKEKDNE